MKIHELKPAPGSNRARRRVGRGIAGKGGKTAGRGTKGQKARDTVPMNFEGGQMPLHMRIPKLKGFNNPFRVEYQGINLDVLDALSESTIDPGVLQRRDALTKAELPIKLDPKLVQLRQDSAQSKTLMANKRLTAAQDLTWALINTPAFLFNR